MLPLIFDLRIFFDIEKIFSMRGLFAINNIIKYSRVGYPLDSIICGVATPLLSVAITSLLRSDREF